MPKLLKFLATAIGGGVALGVGIQLGRSAATAESDPDASRLSRVLDRLEGVEDRLRGVERTPLRQTSSSEIPSQPPIPSEVEKLEASLLSAVQRMEQFMAETEKWQAESQSLIAETVHASALSQVTALGANLNSALETRQKEIIETVAGAIEIRILDRMARLEQDVTSQSASISELRECSMQTERSLQKLLGSLDRIVSVREMPAGISRPEAVPVAASRWKLFT